MLQRASKFVLVILVDYSLGPRLWGLSLPETHAAFRSVPEPPKEREVGHGYLVSSPVYRLELRPTSHFPAGRVLR